MKVSKQQLFPNVKASDSSIDDKHKPIGRESSQSLIHLIGTLAASESFPRHKVPNTCRGQVTLWIWRFDPDFKTCFSGELGLP